MVEYKRALALHVVVSAVAQPVVLTDQNLCAATGELHRRELRLVVLLKSRTELAVNGVVAKDGFDGCGMSAGACPIITMALRL
jgi:hypothetical protein